MNPSQFSHMLHLLQLPLMLWLGRPQKPQNCLLFHRKSAGQPAWLRPDGLDWFRCAWACRPWSRVAPFVVCNGRIKCSLVTSWLTHLYLLTLCASPWWLDSSSSHPFTCSSVLPNVQNFLVLVIFLGLACVFILFFTTRNSLCEAILQLWLGKREVKRTGN